MAQIVAQRYQLLEELGRGGMGTVYRGWDTHTNRLVAIKQLKPELTSPELIERFSREGAALRELDHPNIVKMLDEVAEQGQYYLIIEYFPGGDINDLLREQRLPVKKVLQLGIDICDALTRAHRLHIIHRDLKPANVLIAEDGTPRLTDFGVAYIGAKARVTESEPIIGTLDYVAPEILRGEAFGPTADIWAFGVMLFEMLAGQRPFSNDGMTTTLAAILMQAVPDLEALCPAAPIALVDLVYRMLEKNPDARIGSVRHVGAELEDILQGRDVPVRSESRFATPTPDLLSRPRHNLPAQTTPFVGREAELRELGKMLDDPNVRLITVLAPGGMGKTRLALEAANRSLPKFSNGVYLVELAPLSDPATVVSAIADAIGFQFQGSETGHRQQLLDYLHGKTMLLVLDNYEHLLDEAALTAAILQAAQRVTILATSRQRLSQPGETLFHLAGMDFPDWESPADALRYAAVRLFMNNAQRAQPDFELTADNLDYVARICRLVQGMPLGIVLAAGWIAMLSPQEIADEIQSNIDFLTDESGAVPPRQQRIRAVFDYSWQQMTEAEQQVLMKLSVFRGGFTRDAAQIVGQANLRILMGLINKALLQRDADRGRFEIHELLRQYAEAKLEQADPTGKTQQALSEYYLQFVHAQSQNFYGHGQRHALQAVHEELDNVRAAWRIAVQNRDVALLDQACELWFVLYNLSLGDEGLALYQSALAIIPASNRIVRGKLLACMPAFAAINYQVEQMELYAQQGFELLKDTNEHRHRIIAQLNMGHVYLWRGGDMEKAAQAYEAGLEEARREGDKFCEAMMMLNLGALVVTNGCSERGIKLFQDGLAISQAIGDQWIQAFAYENLAHCAMVNGHFAEAATYAQAGLRVSRSLKLYLVEFASLLQLINLALVEENLAAVSDYMAQAHSRLHVMHRTDLQNRIISLEAILLIEQGQLETARSAIYGSLVAAQEDGILPHHLLPIIAFYMARSENLEAARILGLASTLPDDSEGNYEGDSLLPHLQQKLFERLEPEIYHVAYEQGQSLNSATLLRDLLTTFGD